MDESFIRLRTFTCVFLRDDDATPAVPQGPTLGDQATEFFHHDDAWPVAMSTTIAPTEYNTEGQEVILHLLTLAWIPRKDYVRMQAQISAKAKMLLDEQLAALNEEEPHGQQTSDVDQS